MLKSLPILGLLMTMTYFSQGQCPGCVASDCSAMLPDGGICDTVLTTGMANHAYDDTVSFFMPQTVVDPQSPCPVDLNRIEITGIQGLPLGLQWESDKAPSNEYFPTGGDEHGCVRICGTPLATGTFDITVYLLADVYVPCLSISLDNQPQTYETRVTILPDTNGGVSSFIITPNTPVGCDALTLDFEALIDGGNNITTYHWDFGDGSTATGKTPPTHNFSTPGTYPVTLTTTIHDYEITQVKVLGVSGDYCGDIEELTCGPCWLNACPDLYFRIPETGFDNRGSGSNSETETFGGLSIVLPAGDDTIGIEVWDEDNGPPLGSNDDNLGATSFTPVLGTVLYSAGNGTFGEVLIDTVIGSTIQETLEIIVGESPAQPMLMSDGDSICSGDTAWLYVDVDFDSSIVEWYEDTTLITGATDSMLSITAAGNYSVIVYDLFSGCHSQSNTRTITRFTSPPSIMNLYEPSPGTVKLTNLPANGFEVEWYLDGILLPGVNGTEIPNATPGDYSVLVYNVDMPECDRWIGEVTITGWEEIRQLSNLKIIDVFPNPSEGNFAIRMETSEPTDFTWAIQNMNGQKVAQSNPFMVSGFHEEKISLQHLQTGLYLLQLTTDEGTVTRRILIQ